jgi:hypothetical protein
LLNNQALDKYIDSSTPDDGISGNTVSKIKTNEKFFHVNPPEKLTTLACVEFRASALVLVHARSFERSLASSL